MKKTILIFLFFGFFLPLFSLAGQKEICYTAQKTEPCRGGRDICYTTELKESIKIGSLRWKCCAWSCSTDAQGNTTCTCERGCYQAECGKSWTEYRAESSDCGVKILKRIGTSVGTGEYDCCSPTTCKAEYSDEDVVAVCNPWQRPKRVSGRNPTLWGLEKVICVSDGRCPIVPTLEISAILDGNGEIKNWENVALPVKFQWEVSEIGGDTNGMGLSCGAKGFWIRIGDLERKIPFEEAFSAEDQKELNELWKMRNASYITKFLFKFTQDPSLVTSSGAVVKKTDIITEKGEINLERTISSLLKPESYPKIESALRDERRKKQIEYFIYFKEDKDIEREINKTKSETEDDNFCACFGGKKPEYETKSSPVFLTDVKLTYSPSQDKKIGPCQIPSGQSVKISVGFWFGEESIYPYGPSREKAFKSSPAPEPLAILSFTLKNNKLRWQLGTTKDTNYFEAEVERWIDTDWNGKDYVPIDGDFVDFEYCGQDPKFPFKAMYKSKVAIVKEEFKDFQPDLEIKRIKTKPERCEEVDKASICESQNSKEKCLCENVESTECGFVKWEEGMDLCNPRSGSLSQLRWKEGLSKEQIQERIDKECQPVPFDSAATTTRLATRQTIILDWLNDPYSLGQKSLVEISYPKDLRKFDLLEDYFLRNAKTHTINVWQLEGGQKWQFSLNTKYWQRKLEKDGKFKFTEYKWDDFKELIQILPETEIKGNFFNRIQWLSLPPLGRFASFKIEVYTIEAGSETKIIIPKFLEQFRLSKERIIERRIWHNLPFWEIWPSLKPKELGKYETREERIKALNEWRLNRDFIFYITPCSDEWGENCWWDRKEGSISLKTTGAPPQDIFPQPPEIAKVPRIFDWIGVTGSPAYLVTFKKGTENEDNKGTENEKTFVVQYLSETLTDVEEGKNVWFVRTCADLCANLEKEGESFVFLHCGKESDKENFYACHLFPPAIQSFQRGQIFLPDEEINLSFSEVGCNETTVWYQVKVVYFLRASYEKREFCKEEFSKEILEFQTTDNSLFLGRAGQDKFQCHGTYNVLIRACINLKDGKLDEKECGDFIFSYFNIFKEKPKEGGGKFQPIGTCQRIVPEECKRGQCGIKDLPKLIFNILNCLLWTGTPILLIIGIGATAISMVFFATNVEMIENIKLMWTRIGIGILIMFLAWTILNLIFAFLGWKKEFGNWFEPF